MANEKNEGLVRIMSQDISTHYNLLYGLSKIKGVSYMFANAICTTLGYDKNMKIGSLKEEDIEKIENFLTNPEKQGIPSWLLNSRKDLDSGDDFHYTAKDLDFKELQTRRRLTKIKSVRGLRHKFGLTVRGQRTKSNFRKNKTLKSIRSKNLRGKK